MRAAFGAARDMHGETLAGKRHLTRDLGRQRARRDQTARASRRARTGDDAAAWVGGVGNEAEPVRLAYRGNRIRLAERPEQQSAVRRRPRPARTLRHGDLGKLLQGAGLGVAEGEANAESARASFQRMQPDRLRARL